MKLVSLASLSLCAMAALAQTPAAAPKPAPAAAPKPAAAKPAAAASSVDSVIQSVKAGLSESIIIRTIQRENKPANLTTADLVKLKNAGVSENIINVMLDPTSAPAAAAAPAARRRSAAAAPRARARSRSRLRAATAAGSAHRRPARKPRRSASSSTNSITPPSRPRCKPSSTRNRTSAKASAPCSRSASPTPTTWWSSSAPKSKTHEGAGFQRQQPREARQRRARRPDFRSRRPAFRRHRRLRPRRQEAERQRRRPVRRAIGGIAASKNEDKAVVVIDYRLIDAETSEIIATGEARGESVRKGNALGAIGGALGKGVAGVQVDMTSSNFARDHHR